MLQLQIETQNAAFAEQNEGSHVAQILREVADRIEQESKLSKDNRALRDVNGNTVGYYKTWSEQYDQHKPKEAA